MTTRANGSIIPVTPQKTGTWTSRGKTAVAWKGAVSAGGGSDLPAAPAAPTTGQIWPRG